MPESIDIQYPLAGMSRRLSFQSEAPYTSQRLKNAWPRDPIAGRLRGGSRPGLIKAFSTALNGPVHLLANVRVKEDTGLTTFVDRFDGPPVGSDIAEHWSIPGWSGYQNALPTVGQVGGTEGRYAYVYDAQSRAVNAAAAVLVDLGLDTASQYVLKLMILRNFRETPNPTALGREGRYSLFCRMANTAPNPAVSGIELRFNIGVTGLMSWTLLDNGTAVASATVQTGADETSVYTLLTLTVLTTNQVTATVTRPLRQDTLFTALGINAHTGRRVGFAIDGSLYSDDDRWIQRRVDYFSIDYKGTTPAPNRNCVVAVGGTNASTTHSGEVDLRYEDFPGELTAPSVQGDAGGDAALNNAKARHMQAAELLGKLYVVGEDAEAIWRLDPTGTGTLINLADAVGLVGTVPTNCLTIAAWRNRICVVQRDDPQNLSMARVSTPTDWQFASIPVGSACKLNTTGIDAGQVGEPINCLIPHSDDYLLLGCLNSLWVLRGDPTLGGQVDRLSSVIGISAPQAWARGPNGETVLLSFDGLYGLPPGVLAYPESISREKLPEELRDIDQLNYRVLMAYDVRNRGVFIGLTPTLRGVGKYWWFDWETRGFQEMFFDSSHEPMSLVYRHADSPLDQRLLLGCRDGFVRAFDSGSDTDDGVSVDSEVLIGPLALGGGGYFDGMLLEVVGQLGLGSDNVDCWLQSGKSIEEAYEAEPRLLGTLTAGKNRTFRPRRRGNACFIRLTSSGQWAYENLTIVRERLGKQRL